MTDTDSWTERDDDADGPDTHAVAEQMRAATRTLRAHLSLVRDPDEEPRPAR